MSPDSAGGVCGWEKETVWGKGILGKRVKKDVCDSEKAICVGKIYKGERKIK